MKRALIGVYNKTGIVEFVRGLVSLGWEIVSTGGTAKSLKDNGIEVIEVEEVTGFPESFEGRVKTLHPKIHGGILAIRDNKLHKETMEQFHITPIDMVVCNLYPFKETMTKDSVSHEEIIENIDIGGPSMLRAAAKNFKFVTVVVEPEDYPIVLNEIREKGGVGDDSREFLAAKAFQHTSNYDGLISSYFNRKLDISLPKTITLTFEKKQELRYGENPHQKAAFYSDVRDIDGTLSRAIQIHGKELSYNNIGDINSSLKNLKEFDEATVVAVKHGNPCGIGCGTNIEEAFIKAYEGDKLSIFGGIIAANRKIDERTAQHLSNIFIEAILAPSYSDRALEILKTKKNIRILKISDIEKNDYEDYDFKRVLGGLLVQERNIKIFGEEIEMVTKRNPTNEEMEDLLFAWKAVKNVASNAIVIAKNKGTIGIGVGQTSRIWALENGIKQGGDRVRGSVMASDGFLPFPDSIIAAAESGITAIIQPGGAIRDKEIIETADRYDIAMIFTGIRHFTH